jgi:hypothetical protein
MIAVALVIVVLGLIYIAIMLALAKLTLLKACGFMVFVVVGVLVVTVVVPNASSISHLIVKAGQYFSLRVDMAQQATQVHEDTAENRQIKQQIQVLANRVAESERNVAIMRDNVAKAYQALFETLVIEWDTRHVQFVPPPGLTAELERRLNYFGNFAYGSSDARIAAVHNLNQTIGHIVSTPTPMAAPTPQH